MNVDAQVVIEKLSAKLAQLETNNAILEATIEVLKAKKKEGQEKGVK